MRRVRAVSSDSLTSLHSAPSSTIIVEVPAGLHPGDAMTITVGNDEFTIVIPDGVHGGALLDVDIPSEVQPSYTSSSAPPSTVAVIVPDGCFEGDEFSVVADGSVFSVCVPKGCAPGDEIEVTVSEEAPEEPPEEEPQPQQYSAARLVGRRVELCGLVAKAILNGRRGTVRLYRADRDRLLLSLGGIGADVHVRPEHVRELSPDDEAEGVDDDAGDDEPPVAPAAGAHYVGDRVLVERSDGRRSMACVVEYDEVLETYTVDVGRGVLKHLVEESSLTPYETSQQWVGPSERVDGRWQGFYVGRRVRIPAMLNSSSDDDKNGAIVSYDERSGFYHVELDSGIVRRTVLYRQIKPLYVLREDEVS